MDVGQVGFHSDAEVRRFQVAAVRADGRTQTPLLPARRQLSSPFPKLTSAPQPPLSPPQRSNEIVNRLNKTKEERFPNLAQEKEKAEQQARLFCRPPPPATCLAAGRTSARLEASLPLLR